MVIFINDEQEYVSWLERHPRGFVVNCHKSPSPKYLMLHCADCGMINSERGNHTTHQYIKLCSIQKKQLETWARNEIKGGDITLWAVHALME